MINLEDKKKIQDQQRLDTAREILEELYSFARNHNSLLVCIILNEYVSKQSIQYLGYDMTQEEST